MKKIFLIAALLIATGITSCKKSQLADAYVNPATAHSTTLEKQYAGFLSSDLDYVMYRYWNYFVILQSTALHYTQAVGWQNAPGQYIPGAASITDRWNNFYTFLAQYKEFLHVYSQLTATEQKNKRVYLITATIHFYDQTQKVVDLHGDIPWSEAGLLSTNGGNYSKSYAKYDDAASIYTKMLDDLKGYADELNTISISPAVSSVIATQDFINNGDLTKWKKYCNSLRIKLLTRVSGVSSFQSRVSTEIAQIASTPATYPIVSSNDDNILVKVYDLNTPISSDFYSGIIGWGDNDVASKKMIDIMNTNGDPRLRAMFQPGAKAGNTYAGLDQSLIGSDQQPLIAGGTLSRYNFSTLSKNRFLPGILITSAEVSFLLAEYYLNAGNDAAARTAYENGISQSVDFYYWLRTLSNDSSAGPLAPTSTSEKNTYITSNGINWLNAATTADKLKLIAIQKWTNYSILQPLESWAEYRRTKLPAFSFVNDPSSSVLPQPPTRWIYPTSEQTYNTANYQAVKAKDSFTTKVFWDVK
ncbi:SusD/RagB family nutrient-binding outer membrane lipoprotein [Mucilaginibacter flavidus]|uniref:SusD/RagB family nutrient-binding outer membrane lipoprotein n=1 Tax=Mucilaginibacter flavidus TaxID=2949309 RepID=UPI002093A3D7|nr:SusD/RagB family nutrient-binding outer membrane lipoprotein [Mucilaginibacter flavidus]MCO5946548.1 SusD/RagB family nutrient-binding outer membrane lipoprotein [Mucilaginibacter flavidus]